MASRDTATCPSVRGISPANKQGNNSDSSTPSTKGEATPTPTRKNKRKMSEPRKRKEVPLKRIRLEDGTADVYDEDDDDDNLGVHRLPASSHTPDQSPSSDERNNSTGSGPSPVSTPRPQFTPQFIPGMFPTPVITTIGGIPRYALVPGIPPGFPASAFLPHGLMTSSGINLPGIVAPTSTVTSASNKQLKLKSPDMDKNHNCVVPTSNVNGPSPSGSHCSPPSPSPSVCSVQDDMDQGSRKHRKNYKNMTRERRVEANARERTRVHTISAAFESLRRAVPSYSYHQRLSKLAILRIACSYILALSRLTDAEYSDEKDDISFSECVDLCTQTIQSEGRAKRRH